MNAPRHRFALVAICLCGVLTPRGYCAANDEVRVRAGTNWTAIKMANDANALLEKGDLAGAKRNLDTALKLDPTFWPAHFTRAKLEMHEHKYEAAIRDATTVLQWRSWFPAAAVLRADANRKLGRYAASLADLDQVIAIRAEGIVLPTALNSRAWLRSTCPDAKFRNAQQAIEDAKRACNLTVWKNAGLIDTLAVAYAATGDFDSSLRYEEQAIRVAGPSYQTLNELQQHGDLFKQHRPLRVPPG